MPLPQEPECIWSSPPCRSQDQLPTHRSSNTVQTLGIRPGSEASESRSSEGPEPSTRSKSASSRNWKLTSSVGSSLAAWPLAVGPNSPLALLPCIENGCRLTGAGTRLDERGRGAIVTGGSTLGGIDRRAVGIVVAPTVRDSDTVLIGGRVCDAAVVGMALDSGTSSHPASRLGPETSSVLSRKLPFARRVMPFGCLRPKLSRSVQVGWTLVSGGTHLTFLTGGAALTRFYWRRQISVPALR
jgi:hypothetical protein